MQLNEQRLHTVWQQKVYAKLIGLQYRIVYKKGSENSAADALSRRAHPPSSCNAMSVSTASWLEEVIQSYSQDPTAKEIVTQLAVAPDSKQHFSLCNGVIKYKGKVWLGHSKELQQKVIAALHQSAMGGHSGFPVTYMRIKQYFEWPAMKSAVAAFVKECSICQHAKPDRARYPGLL